MNEEYQNREFRTLSDGELKIEVENSRAAFIETKDPLLEKIAMRLFLRLSRERVYRASKN